MPDSRNPRRLRPLHRAGRDHRPDEADDQSDPQPDEDDEQSLDGGPDRADEQSSDGGPDPLDEPAGASALESVTGDDLSAGEPDPKPSVEIVYRIGALPIRRAWLTASRAELEAEIRGWSHVEKLPEDHGLSRRKMVKYLALLNGVAANCWMPDTWPSWKVMLDFGEPDDVDIEEDVP